MFQRRSTLSGSSICLSILPRGNAPGDLDPQVKELNLSKSLLRQHLGECAKKNGVRKVLAHDDSIFARGTILTMDGVRGCSPHTSALQKCGRTTACSTQKIDSDMMETDLWGDGRLLLCRDSAEKTVSRTIDLDDEEWSDTCEESKPSWSVDDDFNDQMVLVNPLVVESMVNIDGSYTIEQISCQNSFDSDVCEEMNPPCDDDFSLIDFIFDDNRPLCDGQFQDLIENPELVQTAEGECLEYSAAISLDDVLVRVTHEDTVPLDSNQATPADNASPESALPDTERPKRGRPPNATVVQTSPPVSDTEKYRRMRDLNNVASRRCRERRKRKMENAGQELENETSRNDELKMKVRILQEQVDLIKAEILKSFKA